MDNKTSEGPSCDLSQFTPTENALQEKLFGEVMQSLIELKELDDAYLMRIRRKPDLPEKISTLIALEQKCCSFLHHTVDPNSPSGEIWVKITPKADAKRLLDQGIHGLNTPLPQRV